MKYKLISLSNSSRENINPKTWKKVLQLASFYGWQPLGTNPPSMYRRPERMPAYWRGSYFKREGQSVSTEDASSLALALEKALDDIPDVLHRPEDDLPEWFSPMERAIIEEGIESLLLDLVSRNPYEYFAGSGKRHLIQFVKFCKLGSFLIL